MAIKRKKQRIIPVRVPKIEAKKKFSYKEYDLLAKFVSEQGYIVGRNRTGLSQKQQRSLTRAVKRARHLALLPFTQTV